MNVDSTDNGVHYNSGVAGDEQAERSRSMNIFKAMAVKSIDEATAAIPVIDFAPAFSRKPGAIDRVAREVRHASEGVGFFYLAGHGVPQSVVEAAFEASREFHAAAG